MPKGATKMRKTTPEMSQMSDPVQTTKTDLKLNKIKDVVEFRPTPRHPLCLKLLITQFKIKMKQQK